MVGAGPAGLFCALYLLRSGVSVTLIERGKPVEERQKSVDNFIKNGPSDSDFKKVKENLRNKFIESKKENNWHLNSLVSYYKDGWNLEKNYLSTLDTISQEDLRLLLASLYEQGNVLQVVMNGEK